MAFSDDWFLLAEGYVLVNVKDEASWRLLEEFEILITDVPDDEIRIVHAQVVPRHTCYYQVFISRNVLSTRKPPADLS